MDERKPLDERRPAIVSKTSDSIMQRSRSIPIIRRPVPEELPIYVSCHARCKLVADRPHRTNNSPVTRKQHSCSDMDSLVGELPVTRRRLTCRQKREPATRTGQCDDVRQFQAAHIGETESTFGWARGILDSVACKMAPVRFLH